MAKQEKKVVVVEEEKVSHRKKRTAKKIETAKKTAGPSREVTVREAAEIFGLVQRMKRVVVMMYDPKEKRPVDQWKKQLIRDRVIEA